MTKKHEFKFRQKDFTALRDIVYERTGIQLKDGKEEMVYTRISRRLRALNLPDFRSYLHFLTSEAGDAEAIDFVNAMTTNLTRFFRENHHFTHMREEVLRSKVIGSRMGVFEKKIRIWSAACSSGMEAYSIAMTVLASVPRFSNWDVRILATDIDTNMLERGKQGIYLEKDMEDVPDALLSKFVTIENGEAYMDEELKSIISFKRLNLMEDWPIRQKFDIIFCRNVMIYFDKDTQRHLVGRLMELLDEQGVLYVGHAESMTVARPGLVPIGKSTFRMTSKLEAVG
ncbi:MAG: protein-glutamate O-methyltransferase [Kordiimonadaceae bacterium]|nr:protein-glutamate O-methyltransferase [Kordiimonadaceae bacterium]